MYVSFYKHLGVLPTPMAVPEIATALQQRTVDGQENGAIITWAYGWSEFQKYATKTKHIYSGMEILISKKKWDSLTPAQQKIIEDAAKKSAAAQVVMNRNDVEIFYGNMAKKGLEVIDATPQLKQDLAEAAKKVWAEPKTTETFGKETMDRIIKEMGAK
jgi:TRAP-type C4-dicarboxylate transport system substrate-binding protein